MRTLTRFARYLVPSVLMVGLVSLGAPCAAQEAEAPALDAARDGRGSVFVPGAFLGAVAPVDDRVSVNLYGFYYGEVGVPVAQVDVPIRTTRFLTITPSYLYYEVPPSGLDTASQVKWTLRSETLNLGHFPQFGCLVRRLLTRTEELGDPHAGHHPDPATRVPQNPPRR